MSERKVLNKYFPPDFDPSKIPRRKMGKDKQQVVRLMAPYSMRCNTCGEYIYKGKKFNARKETVDGEDYYGIKIFRFYIKCTQCSAEITFKTDPKNSDYTAEHGAQRNFEPWRDHADELDEDKLNRLEEEENNPMAALENKSVDSKREMDILDALQELKTRNARIERAGKGDKIVDGVTSRMDLGDAQIQKEINADDARRKREAEEDEAEISKVFGRAYVAGVPDIEVEGAASSSSSEDGTDDGTSEGGSEASGSGSASGSATLAAAISSIKRKLDAVEPTPAELLSAASRSFVAKTFGAASSTSTGAGASGLMGPPKKKKGKGNSDLASKLGIKLKK